MTTNAPARTARSLLWFLPFIVVPAALFASLPWLKQQDKTLALSIAAAAAIFVMSYSLVVARRITRRLDEVEIAGQRFAQSRGWMMGIFAAGLLLLFPPVMNGLADLANSITAGAPDKAVRVAIVIGFVLLVVLQTLGVIASAIWWQRRLK